MRYSSTVVGPRSALSRMSRSRSSTPARVFLSASSRNESKYMTVPAITVDESRTPMMTVDSSRQWDRLRFATIGHAAISADIA